MVSQKEQRNQRPGYTVYLSRCSSPLMAVFGFLMPSLGDDTGKRLFVYIYARTEHSRIDPRVQKIFRLD